MSRKKSSLAKSAKEKQGLDYEIRFSDLQREWQIWTPAYDGSTGAIIGIGKTEAEAKSDAIRNMKHLSAMLVKEPTLRQMGIKTDADYRDYVADCMAGHGAIYHQPTSTKKKS